MNILISRVCCFCQRTELRNTTGTMQPICVVAASVISLSVCVMGVAFSIFWHYNRLAIPFTCGILASAYSFYYAFQFPQIQTLGKTVQELTESVEIVESENKKLTRHNQELKQSIDTLTKERKNFILFVHNFKSTMNQVHKNATFHNNTLAAHLNRLEAIVSGFETQDQKANLNIAGMSDMLQESKMILGLFDFKRQLELSEQLLTNQETLKTQIAKDEQYTAQLVNNINHLKQIKDDFLFLHERMIQRIQDVNASTEELEDIKKEFIGAMSSLIQAN